jgi:hypothetical protein
VNKNNLKKHLWTSIILGATLWIPSSPALAELPKLGTQGVRLNVLWPIYPGNKYRFAYRHQLNANTNFRTDGLIGLGISTPEDRDTEGRFSETSVVLGVRQFLDSPFHLEMQAAIGRSRLERHVTENRDYRSTDIELMVLAGYEWSIASWISVDLQAGVAKVAHKSNPWPIYEDNTLAKNVGEQIAPVGAVNVTLWF